MAKNAESKLIGNFYMVSLLRVLIYFSLNFPHKFHKNQSRQINGQSIATQIYLAINNRLENSRWLRHIQLRTFAPSEPIAIHAQEQHILFAMRSRKKKNQRTYLSSNRHFQFSSRSISLYALSWTHCQNHSHFIFIFAFFFCLYFYML